MKYFVSVMLILLFNLSFSLTREEIMITSSYFHSNVNEINAEIKKLSGKEDDRAKKGILYLALATQEPPVEKASANAIKTLEVFEKKNVEPLLKAYVAMAYSLGARDDKNPLMKMKYSDMAIKLFNKIVDENPTDWYIRFLRGNTFSNFPEMFQVGSIAKSDFEFIRDLYEGKKENIGKSLMVTVYFYLGEFAKSEKQINKALDFWKKAVAIAEENGIKTDAYKKAKARIKVFED